MKYRTPLLMMSFLKKLMMRWRKPGSFPLVVKDLWYCGMWAMYKGDRETWPIEGKVLFDVTKVGLVGRDESGLVDGLIPAISEGGKVGLYKVTGHYPPRNCFYDGAPWDNGYSVDLELVEVRYEKETVT